jgi:hypothetical protein
MKEEEEEENPSDGENPQHKQFCVENETKKRASD